MRDKEIVIGDVLRGAGTRHPDWHFTSFYGWLRQSGFFVSDDVFYRVEDNVASICSLKDIGDYIEGHLFVEYNRRGKVVREYADHLEMYNRNKGRYLNERNLLLSLGEYRGKELRDSRDTAYFPFLNGIVVVNRDGVELRGYDDVLKGGEIVYKDKIVKRNVEVIDREHAIRSDFADFCRKAIDGSDTFGTGYKYLMRALGYMLHNYKDPATAKMVFFSDCNNTNGISEGRTGKSLCGQVALRQLRQLVTVDGKQFDYQDRYMLDNVEQQTDIVCMQDMRRGFNQETLYNLITGDFQVGKKYKSKTVIPFEKAPKIIADSNFSIKLNGSSDLARICVIGFGHFFSYERTPSQYYKKRFFDDWNDNDFNLFFSFMFYCVKDYLNKGVASYRLNEIAAYSVYNRYPVDLCNEIKDILSSDDNFFTRQIESKEYWNKIGWFNSDASDMSDIAKLQMLTDVMREFGWVRHKKNVTIHRYKEGLKDTTVALHWFEKVGSGGI